MAEDLRHEGVVANRVQVRIGLGHSEVRRGCIVHQLIDCGRGCLLGLAHIIMGRMLANLLSAIVFSFFFNDTGDLWMVLLWHDIDPDLLR